MDGRLLNRLLCAGVIVLGIDLWFGPNANAEVIRDMYHRMADEIAIYKRPQCGAGDGNAFLMDRLNGRVQINAHDIADTYMSLFRLKTAPPAVERAWRYVHRNNGDVEAAAKAFLESLSEADRARWNEESRQYLVQWLQELAELYRAVIVYEGIWVTPEIVAAMFKDRWVKTSRGKLSSDVIAERILAYSKGYQENRNVSAHYAAVKANMRVRFDIDKLGGSRPAYKELEWPSTLAPMDGHIRRLIAQELYPVVFADKKKRSRFGLEYVFMRGRVMQCVGYNEARFQPLAASPDRSAMARFVVDDGQWCDADVAIQIDADEPDFFLGDGLTEFMPSVWPIVGERCSAANRATVDGYIEAGTAHVFASAAQKSAAGWTLADARPNGQQIWFLEQFNAALGGDAMAQANVAFAYESGQAISRNLQQAVAWYERAAKQGDSLAQAEFGRLLAQGKGITTDTEQAIYWTSKSAEQGDPLGIFNRAALGFPLNNLSRIPDLIQSGNLVVDFVGAITGTLDAVQICAREPYRSNPRYISACQQIRDAYEFMNRPPPAGAGGGAGAPGNNCPTLSGYSCNAGVDLGMTWMSMGAM